MSGILNVSVDCEIKDDVCSDGVMILLVSTSVLSEDDGIIVDNGVCNEDVTFSLDKSALLYEEKNFTIELEVERLDFSETDTFGLIWVVMATFGDIDSGVADTDSDVISTAPEYSSLNIDDTMSGSVDFWNVDTRVDCISSLYICVSLN